MKTEPDKNMHTQFISFMDNLSDYTDDFSDGAYQRVMQDCITGCTGWNDQNNDDLDGYEGFMYWVKHSDKWTKQKPTKEKDEI